MWTEDSQRLYKFVESMQNKKAQATTLTEKHEKLSGSCGGRGRERGAGRGREDCDQGGGDGERGLEEHNARVGFDAKPNKSAR